MTVYTLGTHTSDSLNNTNSTWVNHTITTLAPDSSHAGGGSSGYVSISYPQTNANNISNSSSSITTTPSSSTIKANQVALSRAAITKTAMLFLLILVGTYVALTLIPMPAKRKRPQTYILNINRKLK